VRGHCRRPVVTPGEAQPSPARPRLVLHIGTHKTGTTAIQEALYAARGEMARQGVLYPDTHREPLPELPKHSSVFHAAARQDDLAKQARERDILFAEFAASGAHTMVLSAEGLSEPMPRIARFFTAFRADFDIDVVLLVRRQDLFVESLYSQFVRDPDQRESRSLVQFAGSSAIRRRMDFAAVLQPWHDELGARATVLDYGATRNRGLLPCFVEAAGLQIPPLAETSVNHSPDMRLVLALRHLHQSRCDHHRQALANAVRQLGREGRHPPLKHLLGVEERRRLLEAMAPANERLAARYGVRFDPTLPKYEGARPIEDVEPDYLLDLLARMSLSTPVRAVTGIHNGLAAQSCSVGING